MMTWGISDYVNELGERQVYMTLVFLMQIMQSPTDEFLEKFKAFEEKILDDAVSILRLVGEEMSREVAKHTFFPT